MKIKSISIKGWRSFNSEEEVEIGGFKKMNLIIGRNNTGKSNLMKFFQYVVQVASQDESRLNNNTVHPFMGVPTKGVIMEGDFWATTIEKASCKIVVAELPNPLNVYSGQREFSPINHYQDSENQVGISISFEKFPKDSNQNFSWDLDINPHSYSLLSQKPFGASFYDGQNRHEIKILNIKDIRIAHYSPVAINSQGENIAVGISLEFLRSFIFIDPIRHLTRKADSSLPVFDGHELLEFLIKEKRQNKMNSWIKFQSQLRTWMSSILNEEIDRIEPQPDTIHFEVLRGGTMIRQNLDQLGTGVSQMIMLLSHLWWNKDKTYNVFMDEPENNLHPESVARFMRILEGEDFKNHRFFIASHSAALMDLVNENWTVHRTEFTPEKGTKFVRLDILIEKHKLLDDLGFRASQLMQSNFVIWVEGPSDRIYFKRWIELISGGELIEGKHYSFVFFGGANLKHYDFLNEDSEAAGERIDLFLTSRYAAIVHDSDKRASSANSKSIVQRIREKIDDEKVGDQILLWETAGREIENYIPERLWNMIINESNLIKKYVLENSNQINLEFTSPSGKPGEFDDFKEFLFHGYTVADNGGEPSTYKGKIVNFLNSRKVDFARFFAKHWEMEDFEDSFGLRSSIEDLIDAIKRANRIEK